MATPVPAGPRLSPLYAICDADVCARARWRLEDFAAAVVEGGARLLQVRAKGWPGGRLFEAVASIVDRSPNGVLVIVNDRADVARLAAAAGVHVGQDDLRPAAVRGIVGRDAVIGVSTHTAAQVEAALPEPVTYVAVGPVFGTPTKATGYDAVGTDFVRYAVDRAAGALPVVAIGGITLDNCREVLDAGAASVAVISDLLTTGDPAGRTRRFLRRLGAA